MFSCHKASTKYIYTLKTKLEEITLSEMIFIIVHTLVEATKALDTRKSNDSILSTTVESLSEVLSKFCRLENSKSLVMEVLLFNFVNCKPTILLELLSPIHQLAKFNTSQHTIPAALENSVLKIAKMISTLLESRNASKRFIESWKTNAQSYSNILITMAVQLLEGTYRGKLAKPLILVFLEVIGKLFKTCNIFAFSVLKSCGIMQSFSRAIKYVHKDPKILTHIVDSLLNFCYSTLAISLIESNGLLEVCTKRLTERWKQSIH